MRKIQNLRAFYNAAAPFLAAVIFVSCDAPSGASLKSKDWITSVPIGKTDFDGGASGFSLSKLGPDDIQACLGTETARVYGSYETINTNGAPTPLWIRLQGGQIFKGTEQQTYLIHYPVPLGEADIKNKMKESFNAELDTAINNAVLQIGSVKDGNYIEQPPLGVPMSFPVRFNPSMAGMPFNVKSINGIVFDVRLEFKDALPKINGTGAEINESNKAQFLEWVTFETGEPAAAIDLSEISKKIVIWRSSPKTYALAGSPEVTLVNVTFDLKPRRNTATGARGIKYNPDMEVKNFTSIVVNYPAETEPAAMGDTGGLADLNSMLGGAEFEAAYMLIFSEAGISGAGGGIILKATARDMTDEQELVNGALTPRAFRYKSFYSASGAQQITASGAPVNLTDKILKIGAPFFDLTYKIKSGSDITISNGTGIDIVMLIPLKFKVVPNPGDPKAAALVDVDRGNPGKNYIKLNVPQLDNILGESNDFDLKEILERQNFEKYGKIKKVRARLVVANKTLPEELKIGITYAGRGSSIYDDLINLEDGSSSTIEYDMNAAFKMPRPALLVESDSASEGTFKIAPVQNNNGGVNKNEISVRIDAEVEMDVDYKIDF